MYHSAYIIIDYNTFYNFTQMCCDFKLQAVTPQHYFIFKCALTCMCVGLPLCFEYSQDDRHSIYLDVYCFELLGIGKAWAGIHIRKRPI